MKAYRDSLGRKLIAEQAVQWLCDLRDADEGVRQAFYSWLKQSPRHVEEFLLASSLWKALDRVGPTSEAEIERAVVHARASEESGKVIPLATAEDAPRVQPSSEVATAAGAQVQWPKLAAAIAGVLGTGAIVWSVVNQPSDYVTGTGEQYTITLPDRSILYLNSESRAKLDFSAGARRVQLLEGEALFVVAHEPARPFVVTAGTATIQALGTRFNVRRRETGAKVSVVEGRVKVTVSASEQKGASTLAAGEEVQVTPQGQIVRTAEPEVAAAVAWRERRLVFRGETLAEVASEFNRYSQRPIRIEGATAAGKRLAGTFDADDPESLILFLENYPDLAVDITPEQFLIRGRSDGAGFVNRER